MTVEVRPFASFGSFRNEWLDTRYHFSFADYNDPARMGVGPLCVWNDDLIAPGAGFDPHPHRDMEIITYVRSGAITHHDDAGNTGKTLAGDVQMMSAGSGIVHAEYNLEDEPTEIFQIWILPRHAGREPRWATRRFPRGQRRGRLVALASGRGPMDDALEIDQDATLLGASVGAGDALRHALAPGHQAYLVPLGGAVDVAGRRVEPRDAVIVRGAAA
jgi:redox-sensitive bicupin YhaK (pirin superfamily)